MSKRLLYTSEALGSEATLNPAERTLSNSLSLSSAEATPLTRSAGPFPAPSPLGPAPTNEENHEIIIKQESQNLNAIMTVQCIFHNILKKQIHPAFSNMKITKRSLKILLIISKLL